MITLVSTSRERRSGQHDVDLGDGPTKLAYALRAATPLNGPRGRCRCMQRLTQTTERLRSVRSAFIPNAICCSGMAGRPARRAGIRHPRCVAGAGWRAGDERPADRPDMAEQGGRGFQSAGTGGHAAQSTGWRTGRVQVRGHCARSGLPVRRNDHMCARPA